MMGGEMMGGETMGGDMMGGGIMGVKPHQHHSMPCQAPFEPSQIAELLSCVVPAPTVRT